MKKTVLFMLALALCLCTACGDNADNGTDTQTDTLSAGVTGSARDYEEPYNLALVAGIVNNNPVLDTSTAEIARLSALPGSTYCFILADGTPSVISEGEIPDFTQKGYTDTMLERVEASITTDLASQLAEAAPDSPETDIAAAMTLAVRGLRANAVERMDNLLVFYHSGLSTTGVIDMTETPVYDLDIESSVEAVASSLSLDLSGIDIIWYCCGDTNGGQPALSESEISTLQQFYESLLLELGAQSVTFMQDLPLAESYSFPQEVSAVETTGTASSLQARVVNYEDISSEAEVDTLFADGEILSFDETAIAFQPDSTELADADAALEALSYVVEYMNKNPTFELLICGTTTSAGEEASCLTFSAQRAQTIAALLVEAGIDEARVHTLGCGYSSCLYVYDRTADGTLDESVAPLNRSSKLLDYNSDTAAEILSDLNQ